MDGFALTLKQRFDASQKWPILRANLCMRFIYRGADLNATGARMVTYMNRKNKLLE